jgi:hypothetical protein
MRGWGLSQGKLPYHLPEETEKIYKSGEVVSVDLHKGAPEYEAWVINNHNIVILPVITQK